MSSILDYIFSNVYLYSQHAQEGFWRPKTDFCAFSTTHIASSNKNETRANKYSYLVYLVYSLYASSGVLL